MTPEHDDEVELVLRLRAGDEAAFTLLIDRHHESMVRVARSFVSSDAVAEDVAQETWLAVVRGVDRFEGRSSLKTWLFRILVNRAKSRGVSESRSVPFSALDDGQDGRQSVDPDRFLDDGHRWAGYWAVPPQSWRGAPELAALSAETRGHIGRALTDLPAMQQAVVTLRDVRGLTPAEVCESLAVTEANQRVLLHRGRCKLRSVLESYVGRAEAS